MKMSLPMTWYRLKHLNESQPHDSLPQGQQQVFGKPSPHRPVKPYWAPREQRVTQHSLACPGRAYVVDGIQEPKKHYYNVVSDKIIKCTLPVQKSLNPTTQVLYESSRDCEKKKVEISNIGQPWGTLIDPNFLLFAYKIRKSLYYHISPSVEMLTGWHQGWELGEGKKKLHIRHHSLSPADSQT